MINKKKKYKLADFDYPLPEKYIAQYPAKRRDLSKLMVVDRETGDIEHRTFSNIVEYFRKNDLIVLNNTKVFPARLYASKDKTEAKVEVFLLRELENELWEVMVRPARKVRIGNKLMFAKNVFCDVIDNTISGGRVVRFEYDGDNFYDYKVTRAQFLRQLEESNPQCVMNDCEFTIENVKTLGEYSIPSLAGKVVDKKVEINYFNLRLSSGFGGIGAFWGRPSSSSNDYECHRNKEIVIKKD